MLTRWGTHLAVCLFIFPIGVSAADLADVVGEGQIRFLKTKPDPNSYTYESKVTILEASLDSGLVQIQTCHKKLDPIRKVVILFNKDRIRDIQVRTWGSGIITGVKRRKTSSCMISGKNPTCNTLLTGIMSRFYFYWNNVTL